MEAQSPLLDARNLVQEFRLDGGSTVRAVSDVSFSTRWNESVGIVGETGSGKSSLARALLQIPRPKSGTVRFRGRDLTTLRGRRLIEARRDMQMIFQDPFGSLDPTWRVFDIVEESLIRCRMGDEASSRRRVFEVLDRVGLPAERYGRRRPGELSGGQCQRVAIARALAPRPSLVICDEAVSSLDVLIQAQVLSLMQELRAELGLSYLFISHDLAVVRRISDRVAVLYQGRLVETAPSDLLFERPLHPYTAALLAAVPGRDVTWRDSWGASASESTAAPGRGCAFRARCPVASERCATEVPQLVSTATDRSVACHYPL